MQALETQLLCAKFAIAVQIPERQSRHLIRTDLPPIGASKYTQHCNTVQPVEYIEKSGDLVTGDGRQRLCAKLHAIALTAAAIHTFRTITLHAVEALIAHAIVL